MEETPSSQPEIGISNCEGVDPLLSCQPDKTYFPHSVWAVLIHCRKLFSFPFSVQLHKGRELQRVTVNWRFMLEVFHQGQFGLCSTCQKLKTFLIQDANEAAYVFAYLKLDDSKHFWRKVNSDLEARPAGGGVWAAVDWCRIHRRGGLFAFMRLRVRMWVCSIWTVGFNGGEKAHLSQHALEPSKGQPAVQVVSNEEPSWANQSSPPMMRPRLQPNEMREVQRSDRQNWWEE